jgi:hypothetical protein
MKKQRKPFRRSMGTISWGAILLSTKPGHPAKAEAAVQAGGVDEAALAVVAEEAAAAGVVGEAAVEEAGIVAIAVVAEEEIAAGKSLQQIQEPGSHRGSPVLFPGAVVVVHM